MSPPEEVAKKSAVRCVHETYHMRARAAGSLWVAEVMSYRRQSTDEVEQGIKLSKPGGETLLVDEPEEYIDESIDYHDPEVVGDSGSRTAVFLAMEIPS